MADYDNTNRGALFTNERKEADNHPDFTGSINVNGVEYYLNAWQKDGKKGPFLSLSVKQKDTTGDAPKSAGKASILKQPNAEVPPASKEPAFDDEIPF